MEKKYLPLDVSSFDLMILNNYLYIDKTEYIYDLFSKGNRYYFFSRPRRFGKTLLISTLKEFFSGNKKLFQNLWISKVDYDWKEYPIIHLDFSTIDHSTADELKISLIRKLQKIAQEYGINLSLDPTLGSMLETLIVEMSKKNGVVILIDEYDKPILDHLKNVERASEQREVLKRFYDVLKGLDKHLRAIFVTGVTRFSKTSLFSGMNNLNDISLDSKAAKLLGYTQQEIEKNLLLYIQDFAENNEIAIDQLLADLKNWYNCYRFSDENSHVYNPFSILYALDKQKFLNYWYQSGTPTFLVHLIKKQYSSIEMISNIEIDQDSLGNFEIEDIPLVPLLFQTGYLTINNYDEITKKFKLDFPNYEVKLSFSKFFVSTLAEISPIKLNTLGSQLIQALNDNDIEKFCSVLRTLFAHVPYTIIREDYYHALLQFLLSLLSLEAQSEILTDKGRIDLVICTAKYIYIFELKVNSKPEIALAQIKERKYYERFLGKGKNIILIGLNFITTKEKTGLNWVVEKLK